MNILKSHDSASWAYEVLQENDIYFGFIKLSPKLNINPSSNGRTFTFSSSNSFFLSVIYFYFIFGVVLLASTTSFNILFASAEVLGEFAKDLLLSSFVNSSEH